VSNAAPPISTFAGAIPVSLLRTHKELKSAANHDCGGDDSGFGDALRGSMSKSRLAVPSARI
jgi:hypothetical protein